MIICYFDLITTIIIILIINFLLKLHLVQKLESAVKSEIETVMS